MAIGYSNFICQKILIKGWYVFKENLSIKEKSQFVAICIFIMLCFGVDIDQVLDLKNNIPVKIALILVTSK
jgi:hypothetical protein